MEPRSTRSIFRFCLLTFGLSWTWWTLRLFPHWRESFLTGIPIARASLSLLDVTPGMFAPWIASLFLRWLDRVPNVPRPLGLNRIWQYYLLSVAVPVVAVILAILVYPLFGAESFAWAGNDPFQWLLSLIPITLLASLTALGEEFGWRGFLLPLLLPLGKGKASLIVGAVWGTWHIPIILSGFTYPGQPIMIAVAVFIPSVILISFWFTELFIRSSESVALAALAHGTLNALSEISSPRHFPGLNPMFANPFGPTIGVIVFILMLFLTRTSRNQKGKVAQGMAPPGGEKRDKRKAFPTATFPRAYCSRMWLDGSTYLNKLELSHGRTVF
jgi:uncharacterized protein